MLLAIKEMASELLFFFPLFKNNRKTSAKDNPFFLILAERPELRKKIPENYEKENSQELPERRKNNQTFKKKRHQGTQLYLKGHTCLISIVLSRAKVKVHLFQSLFCGLTVTKLYYGSNFV